MAGRRQRAPSLQPSPTRLTRKIAPALAEKKYPFLHFCPLSNAKKTPKTPEKPPQRKPYREPHTKTSARVPGSMNSGENGENTPREISLSIAPTTGGGFEIQILEDSSVDQLRWRVARKLQTPRDRLTFLHRDK